ncbi:amidohydrolase [Halorubrum sp. JWXQ-INN 858]|uniref:amidohydrolase n=1 Tax=Halorubrum sp. JWXQ-INN 858 TaxID=2690782 RepID=UPI00135B0F1A|nr:amidohydrolase [Halorubrum sp. JWXQ-INN 858]MWV63712.1 amidohydrolase [Halorubrum sp. JWXQ-INN 858]
METEQVADAVAERRERLIALSREIWDRPQTAFEETDAAERLVRALADRGFDVEVGVGGVETGFVARYGEGDPVVGTMGEYDALPGLSQRAAATREPVEAGAPGHGCGHNLFGVGSLGGAFAVADAIDAGAEGTVVYVGTPAEEAGAGKVYLARAGAFDDVDALVAWHPGWYNAPTKGSCLAVNGFEVTVRGESAHAAAAPEAGRSALDGIQLLNTAVEYMREHVPDPVRLHYVITEGGDAANVVPPEATAEYLVRAPSRELVEEVSDWFRQAARGAALMADVDVDVTQTSGVYGVRPNETLGDAIRSTMADLGPFEIDGADAALADDLRASLGDVSGAVATLDPEHREAARDAAYFTEPIDALDAGTTGSYSTDSGDVSQIVPLGRMTTATFPVGTPLHSWQAVAASGSTGVEGMLYAAKTIGGTLVRLLEDPDLLASVVAEFEDRGGAAGYESPMPADADPYELLGVERPGFDPDFGGNVTTVERAGDD